MSAWPNGFVAAPGAGRVGVGELGSGLDLLDQVGSTPWGAATTRASAADATAQRVLTAAVTLYADRGHAQVSLDDVARAANVTRGAVYHHYGSRTGLFAAVAEHVQSQVSQAVVAAAVGAGDDPFARLRAGSHAFLDAVTAPGVVQVLLVDAPALIGWQRWRRLDTQHSGRHLCDALADLGVPDDLLDALTAHLSGAMNEAALWLVDHADEPAAPQAGQGRST